MSHSWKNTNPPTSTTLYARIKVIEVMEELTARRNDKLESPNHMWELWHLKKKEGGGVRRTHLGGPTSDLVCSLPMGLLLHFWNAEALLLRSLSFLSLCTLTCAPRVPDASETMTPLTGFSVTLCNIYNTVCCKWCDRFTYITLPLLVTKHNVLPIYSGTFLRFYILRSFILTYYTVSLVYSVWSTVFHVCIIFHTNSKTVLEKKKKKKKFQLN